MKRAKLIFLLILWIAILIGIVVLPAFGVIVGIGAMIVFCGKKIWHLPLLKFKRK